MSEATDLLELQDVDLRLLRCASTLKGLPQQRRLATVQAAQRKVRSELTGIVGQRKDAQTEIADVEAQLAHYQEISAEVQAKAYSADVDHRALRDLEGQLTSLAKRIEKCEFSLTGQREQLARLERAEANARLTQERLEAEREAAQTALDAEAAELKAQIVRLSRERETLVRRLDEATLARYDAARTRFKGLGVERLDGNLPTTCRVKLQPSLYHDLVHGPQITECPYCHRILVVGVDEVAS